MSPQLNVMSQTRPTNHLATTDGTGDWREQATCATADPETWFPHPSDLPGIEVAKGICSTCPVLAACREWAVPNTALTDGIAGGMTPDERRLARRRAGHVTQVRPIKHGTPGGYRTHRRRGEDACDLCTQAERRRQADARTVTP